ncbi:MAG: prepilin-type N-terminal cleavage/methylation domain-containing protein [Patescibacteria group bacterium]
MKNKNGFTLIEILLAAAIFLIIFLGVSFLMLDNLNFSFNNQERIRAEFLAQEGIEATKAIADNNFKDLTDGSHGLAINNNQWQLTDAAENLNQTLKNGQRQIIISDQDTNLKKVESLVTWQDIKNNSKETSLLTFLSNWQRTLGGDWSEPVVDGFYAMVSEARSVFHVGNYTYIGALNFKDEPDFYVFDTADLKNPALVATLDLGANTWATINSIYVVGNYAYLATNINGREFVVLDISDPQNPIDVAHQTTQTLTDATGIHVSGDYAYLTNLWKKNQKQLYVFNIANPLNPDFVSRIDLADSAYNLTFQNNYVFVASGKDDQELQIIDVADPQGSTLYTSLDLPGANDAYDVYVKDNKGYLVRAAGTDSSEFYILDLSNLQSPQIISSLKLASNFRTVYAFGPASAETGDKYMFVGGDLDKEQFQVIDISDLNNPRVISTLDINGIVYDLVTDDVAAYLAVGGGLTGFNGLKIVVPGP